MVAYPRSSGEITIVVTAGATMVVTVNEHQEGHFTSVKKTCAILHTSETPFQTSSTLR
jgi:hypothetical protein